MTTEKGVWGSRERERGVLGILKLGFCEGNEEHMKVLLILD